MTSKKISAVVFDFGGVMTSSTMPERVRKCADKFGIDWSALEIGYGKYRRLADGGFITIEEMYDLIWADAGIAISTEVFKKILVEDYASFLEGYRNLKTLDWMRELKADGYKIGILTNMPPSMEPKFKEVYPEFIALADAIVISGLEKMFKPQRKIYDLLRNRIGLPAEELMFIDDVESNCEGARKAGWRSIRFLDNEQIKRDFNSFVAV